MQLARRGSILNIRARHSATQLARFGSHAEALTQASQFVVCAIASRTGATTAIRHAITAMRAHAATSRCDRGTDTRWYLSTRQEMADHGRT